MNATPFTMAGMSSAISENIDWSRPWFHSVAAVAGKLQGRADRASLDQQAVLAGLLNHRGLPLRFVAQEELPAGMAYESFISATGCVPSRPNLHDFFNALVWLSYPRIKSRLNALQAAQIARDGVGQTRGAARDAITIFDENAALLVLPEGAAGEALAAALRGHHWAQLFCDPARPFAAQVWPFGHALLEKLATPYKAITAHCWLLAAPQAFFAWPHAARLAWLDEAVAAELARLDAETVTTACFSPLPLSGVPGWWPGQDAAFYADASVFRPKRPRPAD